MTAEQPHKVSTPSVLQKITQHWSPKLVATLNDGSYEVKVVKVKGDFVFHSHAHTDELFHILSGEMTMRFNEPGVDSGGLEDVELGPGDVLVVPRGVRHCPSTKEECSIIVVEMAGVINTGDAVETNGLRNEVEDMRRVA